VAAAHPDRGGTHEAAVKANKAYSEFKDGLKRAEQRRAAAERRKAEAAKTAKPVDF